jgi:uncharacterized protein (DUF305 family)/plastocyanin
MAYLPITVLIVTICFGFCAWVGSATCTPSATKFCMRLNLEASETGLYEFEDITGVSPDLTLQIGQTYTFDQTHPSNWYHAVGFAYYPDGAHGESWGGAGRDEIEGAGQLLYKINGAATTCPDAGDTGLDCYEPEFFYPREEWMAKNYTAELTITQAVADQTVGGVLYYFCHIHSKMSGRIIIAGGGSGTTTTGSPEDPLYPVPTRSAFDTTCGTFGAELYAPDASMACSESFLAGTLDTDFEQCMQAIDCMMNRNMRVQGHDTHQSEIVTFMQQMIPHHLNAANMAKVLLKFASSEVAAVEDLTGILWSIINVQNFQVHQFRNYLAAHTGYTAIAVDGSNLNAESVGTHCDATLGVDVTIASTSSTETATGNVAGCTSSDTNFCMKVNVHAGESGYYEFAGLTGPSPEITVKIGQTYTFDQRDPSNWYHPVGFAYYPDGAHGASWGADERAEVEGAGELLYKINDAATTCPDAGDTGLDCYEPEFFYPRADWMGQTYKAELTITAAMADMSKGGVIYYFCHIHSKMSGKIIIQNADGTPYVSSSSQLPLYPTMPISGVDRTCGCTGLEPYNGGSPDSCNERFICGTLDTNFEKCMQAIDCQMKSEMLAYTSADHSDKVAVFMQQMIPHHQNAVSMSKILMQMVPAADITAAMDDDGLTDILYSIINEQNFQIHQFRNYLGAAGLLVGESADTTAEPEPEPEPEPGQSQGTTVEGSFKIENVNYASLTGSLLTSFKGKLAEQIAASAGSGISASHVTVTLSAGSVNVAYVIAVPASVTASSLVDNLAAANTDGSFTTQLVAAINTISGISAAVTGSLGVTNFDSPTVDDTENTSSSGARGLSLLTLSALTLGGLVEVRR